MYISQEELNKRLSSAEIINKKKIPHNRGKNIDTETKVLAGALVKSGESSVEVADALEMSAQTALNASKGLRNQTDTDEDLKEQVDETAAIITGSKKKTVDQAKELALDALVTSLTRVKEVESLSVKDSLMAASISSKILKDFNSTGRENSASAVAKLIIHAPSLKSEDDYSVIEVGAAAK